MANEQTSILLNIEGLSALSIRLSRIADHIETAIAPITMWELSDTATYLSNTYTDIKLAVLVCGALARLRFAIAAQAELMGVHPEWDTATFARDLRQALEDAARLEPEDLPEASRSSQHSGGVAWAHTNFVPVLCSSRPCFSSPPGSLPASCSATGRPPSPSKGFS
jgi:hypothetical protein